MATTHAARTAAYARRGTPSPRVRVYDQEAVPAVPDRRGVTDRDRFAARGITRDPSGARGITRDPFGARGITRDPSGAGGSTHDRVARWVATGSLVLVALLVALVILH